MKLEKYKKYIMTLILTIFIGIKFVSAADMSCSELFGDDIIDLVKEILEYPRIIVPILVILLGMIDFGKAVIASKEDEMKKAQSTFIKRVIIGIFIFFVPAIVEILMEFADIVWAGLGYSTCDI